MITNEQFKDATNLRNCIRVLESLCGHVELEAISYRVGVGYRIIGNVSETDIKILDDLLGMLTNEETETLKKLYL